MRIGIFGRAGDREVAALRDALKQRGVTPVVIDFKGYPHLHALTWLGSVRFDDIAVPTPIELTSLDAVHLRPAAYEAMSDASAAAADHATVARHHRRQGQRLSLQLAVCRRLATRMPVVNPADAFRFHRQKAYQHALLIAHGIRTPEALVTGCPEAARAFVDRFAGRVVAKPQASGAEVVMADDAFLERFAWADQRRPTIFQQYVHGRSYRAYVLGGRIVSTGRIVPRPGRVDWREHIASITPKRADESLAEPIARAVRLLDLPCCGIDVEHDDVTDRDYLLDFNPAAMFVHWSMTTGEDVPGAIAGYLKACAERGEVIWER